MLTNTMRDPIIEAASFFGEELMQMNAGNVLLKRTQQKKALEISRGYLELAVEP